MSSSESSSQLPLPVPDMSYLKKGKRKYSSSESVSSIEPQKRQKADLQPKCVFPEDNSFEQLTFGDKIQPNLTSVHYALCNESQQQILNQLTRAATNSVHLGFSCWLNFDIIAQTEAPRAIVCDNDNQMIALLNTLRGCVIASMTSDDFIDKFWEELEKTENFYGLSGVENEFFPTKEAFREKVKSNGWLSDESKFSFIKNLYQQGKIIHRRVDITDQAAFSQLKNWKDSNGFTFHTVYTSNIPEWVHIKNPLDLKELESAMKQIVTQNTAVITAYKESNNQGSGPELHSQVGAHPQLPYA